MKRLILFVIVLIFSQCQIKVEPKQAVAQTPQQSIKNYYVSLGHAPIPGGDWNVYSWTYELDSVKYRIFCYGSGSQSGDIEIINITKEKLEIEKLKLEIEKLKR